MNIVPIIFTTSGVSELCMRVLVHVGTVVNNKLQSEIQCRAFIDLPREGGKNHQHIKRKKLAGERNKKKRTRGSYELQGRTRVYTRVTLAGRV